MSYRICVHEQADTGRKRPAKAQQKITFFFFLQCSKHMPKYQAIEKQSNTNQIHQRK